VGLQVDVTDLRGFTAFLDGESSAGSARSNVPRNTRDHDVGPHDEEDAATAIG